MARSMSNEPIDPLAQGRAAFRAKRWSEAVRSLSSAEALSPLASEDYEALTVARFLIGPDQAGAEVMAAAHQVLLERGDIPRAARAAFWASATLNRLGEVATGSGWNARAQLLLRDAGLEDSVEHGYLLIGPVFAAMHAGDLDLALDRIDEVTQIARRFDDADLLAFIRQAEGRVRLLHGDVASGMAILDEVMLTATTSELSPIVVGLIFCALIRTAHEFHDLGRAREWTTAVERWCMAQPDLDMYRGECQVYRAHVLQLGGDWRRAAQEVEGACHAFRRPPPHPAIGIALYEQGELHRLAGRYAEAEESFAQAASHGHTAQPGLALLRLGQRRLDVAKASIARALAETTTPLARAGILPAFVEISLAASDSVAAQTAVTELAAIADRLLSDDLHALAGHATGALLLSNNRAEEALPELRRAAARWEELGAAYLAARTRLLIGRACRALGDEDAALLEIGGALQVFRRLGAEPDAREADALLAASGRAHPHGLTAREVELLALLATGKTNREIATALSISEKTVARHVSNILNKLGVSTRAAATAFAVKHDLA